jgi:digeranylgeranylglycerophospholipid reductase
MISIIGAGPAGASAALNLVEDYDVNIYEEHSEVGSPVACTGILTDSLQGYMKIKKDYIINKLNKFEVFGDKESTIFRVKKPNIILDRKHFDQDLVQEAIDKGARLHTSHKLTNVELRRSNIGLKFANQNTSATDILIGADGPGSTVAKQTGLFKNRDFLVGMQCLAKGNFDKTTIQVYMTKSPGMFGWVVPENESIARVGLATRGNTRAYFDKFLDFLHSKGYNYIEGDDQSGTIPKHQPGIKTSLQRRVFLVGDSATQTKNTTAGGIIPGIICGKILSDSIKNNRDYDQEWKSVLGKDLQYHDIIRKSLDSFKDKDHDRLIRILKKKNSRKLIEEFDREFPSKFAKKMLLLNPSLWSFVKNFRY